MARRYVTSQTVEVDPVTHAETTRIEPLIVRVVVPSAAARMPRAARRSVIPAYAVANEGGTVTHYELRGPGTEGQLVPASEVTVEKE